MSKASKKVSGQLGEIKEKQRKFSKDFRDFALKGDAMSLAVGVIIGAAFQGLVNSIVNDLINPVIGTLFKVDFSNLFIPLFNTQSNETYTALADHSLSALKAAGLPVFAYGSFIATLINFFLLALVVFLIMRTVKGLTERVSAVGKNGADEDDEENKEPETKKCPFCTEEIPAGAKRCPHCTSMLEE